MVNVPVRVPVPVNGSQVKKTSPPEVPLALPDAICKNELLDVAVHGWLVRSSTEELPPALPNSSAVALSPGVNARSTVTGLVFANTLMNAPVEPLNLTTWELPSMATYRLPSGPNCKPTGSFARLQDVKSTNPAPPYVSTPPTVAPIAGQLALLFAT